MNYWHLFLLLILSSARSGPGLVTSPDVAGQTNPAAETLFAESSKKSPFFTRIKTFFSKADSDEVGEQKEAHISFKRRPDQVEYVIKVDGDRAASMHDIVEMTLSLAAAHAPKADKTGDQEKPVCYQPIIIVQTGASAATCSPSNGEGPGSSSPIYINTHPTPTLQPQASSSEKPGSSWQEWWQRKNKQLQHAWQTRAVLYDHPHCARIIRALEKARQYRTPLLATGALLASGLTVYTAIHRQRGRQNFLRSPDCWSLKKISHHGEILPLLAQLARKKRAKHTSLQLSVEHLVAALLEEITRERAALRAYKKYAYLCAGVCDLERCFMQAISKAAGRNFRRFAATNVWYCHYSLAAALGYDRCLLARITERLARLDRLEEQAILTSVESSCSGATEKNS
jgi:hypothetical protein